MVRRLVADARVRLGQRQQRFGGRELSLHGLAQLRPAGGARRLVGRGQQLVAGRHEARLVRARGVVQLDGSEQAQLARDIALQRTRRLRDDLPPQAAAARKARAAQDPYCIGIVETVLRDRGAANGKPEVKPTDSALHIYTAGCDGMDFDRDGNLYTGSFGDGRFWVLNLLGNGRYSKPKLLSTDVTCCDGICYDPVRNRMLLTASEQNGIYAWDIAQKKMSVLWSNGDTDGADGLLDQPCEVMMLDENRVLVVNIDAPSPFMVNTKADKVHTLSILTF